jgi:hypothetical protein
MIGFQLSLSARTEGNPEKETEGEYQPGYEKRVLSDHLTQLRYADLTHGRVSVQYGFKFIVRKTIHFFL